MGDVHIMAHESTDARGSAPEGTGREPENYDSDQPIKASDEDRFGRAGFSQRVAQIIATRREPSSIVVGIHAPWGEGKTSVLNMIVEELSQHDHVIVVRFNPWRFPDESQLLANFFTVLADTFDTSLKTASEKIGSFARKYAGVLAPIKLLGIDASDAVESAAGALPEADLEQLKARIEKILIDAGKRVVVIMDDIDRLDKEEVQAVFKLVKLSADFPYTSYILAFDEEKVAEALAEKYGGVEAGRNFLEKIVQVSLPLAPASTEALRSLTFEGIDAALKSAEIQLNEQQGQKFVNSFVLAFDSRLETPRLAKRYVNGLMFSLPLLKGEVDLLDLMLIEGVRTFYPKLYASIRESPDVFLGTGLDRGGEKAKEHAKKVIDNALEDLSDRDQRAARHVIQELFPRTGVQTVIGTMHYGSEWDSRWAKEKRIAAQRYFSRYFSYGVPPNDISDQRLNDLIEAAPGRDVESIAAEIRALTANNRHSVLIEKLRAREESLSPQVAAPLASAIARCGDSFPQDKGMYGFFGASTFAQACILIRHLVGRVDDRGERDSLALVLAQNSTPLPFAVEYGRWIRKLKRSEESDEGDAVISDECEQEVNRRITARIASEAQEEPIEKRYPRDASSLYQFWRWYGAGELRDYLARRFGEHPDEVVDFLLANTREGWSMDSGLSFRMNLERNDYDAIAAMVDPEIIMKALPRVEPHFESPQAAVRADGTVSQGNVALTFARLHKEAKQQAAEKRETEAQSGDKVQISSDTEEEQK